MSDDPINVQQQAPAFESVAPYYDLLMESVPYRFWLKYLHTLWEHHGHEPQRVIDLACGTGTMSLLMARQGLLVTGVDISAKMLEQARRKSADARLFVEYINQDAADLELEPGSYDTVISLFDSLNNIVDPARLQQAFQRVRQQLCCQGVFIFDMNTAYAFKQGMFDQKSLPADGPLQYRWRSTFDERSELCTVSMTFEHKSRDGEVSQFEETHIQRAYSIPEVTSMLTEAGFTSISVYDAYSLNTPKRRSDRIFFLAKTP